LVALNYSSDIWAETFPLPYKPAFLPIPCLYPQLSIILVSTSKLPFLTENVAVKWESPDFRKNQFKWIILPVDHWKSCLRKN